MRVLGEPMRDEISRTLIAFVACHVLFMALLPFVLIPPPESLSLDVYVFGFRTARDLVIDAAAGAVLLFTIAIWIQRRFWLTGFFATVGIVGPSLVLAQFFVHTSGITRAGTADKGALFFLGYLALALFLGAAFWFLAVMERDDVD